VSAGAFALLGVLLGGLLTGGWAYALERRREQRSVRAAARLVQQEFVDAVFSAFTAFHLTEKWKPITRPILVEERVWLEHRAKLAEALSGAAWSDVYWASKHRRDFMDWIESVETLHADDYTETKISNLQYWANRGWDALSAAAGIPRRQRKQLKREREAAQQQA
jgi:hypothetical protein